METLNSIMFVTPGVMKQILDFVQQIAEDSTTHVHAAKKLLIWLTVQVGVITTFISKEAESRLDYH